MPNKLTLKSTLKDFFKTITFIPNCQIAVAVSGGPDSLALTFLLKSLEKDYGYKLVAFHVNHKLRPESDTEALQVKKWLDSANIPCEILEWHHKGITTKIQEQARAARYDLISNACKAQNIKGVFLAHHKEDQYETILYRLSCATGMDGLAGIPPLSIKSGVTYLRPLLSASKKDLISYLDGHDYIQDPSNTNTNFTRVKFRKETEHLSNLGLTVDALVDVAQKAASNRHFIENNVEEETSKCVDINNLGYATVDPDLFTKLDPEIQYRLLNNLLMKIGGNTAPLRQRNLRDFLEKIGKTPISKGESIGNCLIRPYQKQWLIIREPEKITDKKTLDTTLFWDNRFKISGLRKKADCYVAALGKHWENYKAEFDEIALLPSYFWQTLPAIYDKNGIVLELLLQYKGSSDILIKDFNIEFSPYCTQHKSIFDLTKRITL